MVLHTSHFVTEYLKDVSGLMKEILLFTKYLNEISFLKKSQVE